MRVFVTGAGGFLGRAIVAAAVEAGHEVLAMKRPASAPAGEGTAVGITQVSGDLRKPGPWSEQLATADAVIHCAAAGTGDLPTQLAGTVMATENLLNALPKGLTRFVHISSFSVYDFGAPGPFGVLDEATRIERNPARRDAYTQTKLMQEAMVREHCGDHGIGLVTIRPGAIYGPGKDWDHGRAMAIGRFDLIFAPFARMRLVHVEDCARAVVNALNAPVDAELVVNVVGAEQPTHWAYHRASRRAGAKVGLPVPIPYALLRVIGWSARMTSKLGFSGRARLPELLDLPRQQARWRPLRYSGARATKELGWQEHQRVFDALKGITSVG